MYQWTYREQKPTNGPGKLEAGALWPHNNNNNNNNNNERKVLNNSSSPTKRQIDGESKIPKLVSTFSSTPKSRLQQLPITQPASLSTPENSLLLNGTDFDHNLKISELKNKLSKCETIQETLMLIRCFLSEYAMQSSESSTNSSIALTKSILNGSDSTIFDKNDEQTLFSITQKPESIMKTPVSSRTSTIAARSTKSRTSPSTPTSNRTDTTRRFRRNLSTDSVATLPNKETNNNNNVTNTGLCKKCMLISPAKINSAVTTTTAPNIKRFVDKATVMDVEPLSLIQKRPDFKHVEIQTDDLVMIVQDKEKEDMKEEKIENEDEKKTEISTKIPMPPPLPPPLPPALLQPNSSIPPPPPPMPMNSSSSIPIPPAPPILNAPKPPPGKNLMLFMISEL